MREVYRIKLATADNVKSINEEIGNLSGRIRDFEDNYNPRIYSVIIDTNNPNPETALTYADNSLDYERARYIQTGDEWDKIFGYYPVFIKGDKKIRLDPNNFSKSLKGESIDLSEGEVFIRFPLMGIRFDRLDGGKIRISVTRVPRLVDFNYDAFKDHNGEIKEELYIASVAGQFSNYLPNKRYEDCCVPMSSIHRMYLHRNPQKVLGFMQWSLLQCLFILKYKTLDSSSIVEPNTEFDISNIADLSREGMFFSRKSGNNTISKLFGICNLISIKGSSMVYGIDRYKLMVSDGQILYGDFFSDYTDRQAYGSPSPYQEVKNGFISGISVNPERGFFPEYFNGSNSTYYCDYLNLRYRELSVDYPIPPPYSPEAAMMDDETLRFPIITRSFDGSKEASGIFALSDIGEYDVPFAPILKVIL